MSLLANNLRPAEYERAVWRASAAHGLTPADLLAPGYWAHVARQLKPYDRIEALAEEGDWWAEYLVLESADKWARVLLLREHDLRAAQGGAPATVADFEVKQKGIRKHCVVRKADGAVIKDRFETRAEAEDYLASHVKSLAPEPAGAA